MHTLYHTLTARCALLCLALGLGAVAVRAQTVTVPADLNPTSGLQTTYIDKFVTADTTAAGVQKNKVYLLQAGGYYTFTAKVVWRFDVEFRATGDVATLGQPVIDRINITGGTALDPIYEGFGSLTFDNIYMIIGEEGATQAQYENAPIRPYGVKKRYTFRNCTIEKSRQGLLRIEGDGAVVDVRNNHMYNFGDYQRRQGNGRIVDPRGTNIDSVTIAGNYIHNILDRLYIGFRQGSSNYVNISSNTVFNHVGRHGLIQLSNTKESIINNNLFINPVMQGSVKSLADEQGKYKGDQIYLFTLDTAVAGAKATMLNNNVFYTPDVLAHFAKYDTVSRPRTIAPVLATLLGDTSKAIFSEVVTLKNVPDRAPVLKYVDETFQRPNASDLTKMMVEDIAFEGTAFDKGYLFDFSKFDPCYAATARSATAATGGASVGATYKCPELQVVGIYETYNQNIQLSISPNPTSGATNFRFLLENDGKVEINVYDVRGQRQLNAFTGVLNAGEQNVSWDGATALAPGMYLAQIQTVNGRMIRKFVVQ